MKARLLFVVILGFTSLGYAEGGSGRFGLNVGIGLPFLGQVGMNYKISDHLRLSATYNILDLDVGEASAKLTMPEVGLSYHPFGGAFFLGVGAGREKLTVTATEDTTGNEARAEVEATTAIAKLGWMWGLENDGFWFGVDVAYIKPMSPKVNISAPGVPTTDEAYQDVQEAADDFGDTAYLSLTFIRLGYVF